jgi:hypothetical protein
VVVFFFLLFGRRAHTKGVLLLPPIMYRAAMAAAIIVVVIIIRHLLAVCPNNYMYSVYTHFGYVIYPPRSTQYYYRYPYDTYIQTFLKTRLDFIVIPMYCTRIVFNAYFPTILFIFFILAICPRFLLITTRRASYKKDMDAHGWPMRVREHTTSAHGVRLRNRGIKGTSRFHVRETDVVVL